MVQSVVEFVKTHTDLLYFAGGCVSSFATYMLRSMGYTGKNRAFRWAHGCTCMMLTAGAVVAIHLRYDAPYAYAIPVGVLIGFLGADLILQTIKRILEYRFGNGRDE